MYVQELGAPPDNSITEQTAAAAARKLLANLQEAWGPFPGWFTGVSAVQLPNGQYVVEVGLAPGLGRQTLPEVPSHVFGIPVVLTRGVTSLRNPRKMPAPGGWPLTRYGQPIGG